MATIYIDNIIKPKNSLSNSSIEKKPEEASYVYKDLHLDIEFKKNVGNGLNVAEGNDILGDYDFKALQNSIYNIFNSRNGFKILDPDFGCSLDMFIFEKITDTNGYLIGKYILENIEKYEPRITIINVQVLPVPDRNEYHVTIHYSVLNIKKERTVQLQFRSNTTDIL
jgi:phage baseplate assembly protein W